MPLILSLADAELKGSEYPELQYNHSIISHFSFNLTNLSFNLSNLAGDYLLRRFDAISDMFYTVSFIVLSMLDDITDW